MTARGAAVAILGTVAVGIGLLLRWPEWLAIGIALLACLLVPLALRAPRSVTWWDECAPTRIVRGDPGEIILGLSVGHGSTRWVSAVDEVDSARVWLPTGRTDMTLTWPLDTSTRGLLLGGPKRLEAADPLGMSRRVLATRDPSPVLVVPRVHSVDARLAQAGGGSGDDGEQAGSEHFHSLREYVVGDPQKMVHWRSSARAGKLMVRRMVDTTVPWLLVVLDVNGRAYDREGALFEDFDPACFERAVDAAASWAWWGCGPEQRVLLTTTAADAQSAEVTARTRNAALDWLALVAPLDPGHCGPHRVEALLRRRGVGRIVLITGGRTEGSQPWVASWKRTLPVRIVTARP